MSPRSVENLEQLMDELHLIRQRGFSIDDGQVRESMICIGAVIRDHTGTAIAGIATSLMRSEASAEVIEDMGTRMRQTANALSRQMGYAL